MEGFPFVVPVALVNVTTLGRFVTSNDCGPVIALLVVLATVGRFEKPSYGYLANPQSVIVTGSPFATNLAMSCAAASASKRHAPPSSGRGLHKARCPSTRAGPGCGPSS